MNKSAKLLSGVALILSLGGYASAGAFDELKSAVAVPQANAVEIRVSAPSKAAAEEAQSAVYLTGVSVNYVSRLTEDFFSYRVTALVITPDSVLKLPPQPVISQYSSSLGFTVMGAESPMALPGTLWEKIAAYEVSNTYEMLAAVSHLIEGGKLDHRLLQILALPNHRYALNVLQSPWEK